MKHAASAFGILVVSYLVAMVLAPADPVTTIMYAVAIFVPACIIYFIWQRQCAKVS